MLNSCGQALSQGDGSDFHPWWGNSPLVTAPAWELEDDWLHATGPRLSGLTMAAQKSWKNTGMLAGVGNCGRSLKQGCRGRLALGFKPRHGSHAKVGITWFWWQLGPHSFGVLPFATWLRKQERPCWEEKGWKDSCWWALRRCHMVLD